MVIDFSFRTDRAVDENHTVKLIARVSGRGVLDITIDSAPTSSIKETKLDDGISVSAAFKIPDSPDSTKSIRTVLRLLPASEGTVSFGLALFGGGELTVKGAPLLTEKVTTGESKLGYTLSRDGKSYILSHLNNDNITTVVIPDALGDGLPVTAVKDGIFTANQTVKKVVFGNNITRLGNNMFAGCTSLESVVFGKFSAKRRNL